MCAFNHEIRMSDYYRLKKYRNLKKNAALEKLDTERSEKVEDHQLKRRKINASDSDNSESPETSCSEHNLTLTELSHDGSDFFGGENSCNNAINIVNPLENVPESLKSKLSNWALRNLDTLRLNVISELLVLLREEGHSADIKTKCVLLNINDKQYAISLLHM